MAFGQKTVSRLVSVLEGFLPASTIVLILSGLLAGGSSIGGATLSFMGLSLGMLPAMPLGRWLGARIEHPADRRLPLLLGLLLLPLAVLPAHPGMVALERFGFFGWTSVLAGVAAALPLGLATGISWFLLEAEPRLDRHARLKWMMAGIALGFLVGAGSALALSCFRGAFLVILFAAPLAWPTLPPPGPRTLLVRMLLTLLVLLATMSLLFL